MDPQNGQNTSPVPTQTPQPPTTPTEPKEPQSTAMTPKQGNVVSAAVPASPTKKKMALIAIVAVAIIGVITVGIVLFFVIFKNDSQTASKVAAQYMSSFVGGNFEDFDAISQENTKPTEAEFEEQTNRFKELIKSDPEQSSIHVVSDRAVSTYKFKVGLQGEEELDIFWTLLLMKKDGEWFVVNTTFSDKKPSRTKVSDYTDAQFESGSSIAETGSLQARARDTEREADIRVLHAQIEEVYAQLGAYPSLDELNSQTFRSSYMSRFDEETLVDPDGTDRKLAASPSRGVYAYQPSPAGCSGSEGSLPCQGYTLTAIKTDGSTYTKTGLN